MNQHTKAHKRKQTPAETREPEIMSPSRITPLHTQDRELTKFAGAPKAWRKMTQLDAAYQQERLGAKASNDAYRRLAAGKTYTELWDCAQTAGRDSTAAFDVGRCMGSGTPLSEAQRAAISRLVSIEMHLGQNDRTIVRAVCGSGHSPAEAIALARLDKDTRVTARFCEALDALADAVERTHRRGRR